MCPLWAAGEAARVSSPGVVLSVSHVSTIDLELSTQATAGALKLVFSPYTSHKINKIVTGQFKSNHCLLQSIMSVVNMCE